MVDNDSVASNGVQKESGISADALRDVLKYVVEIGTFLHPPMDKHTLLQRIVVAACRALHFRYAVIYLADGAGLFHAVASNGINVVEERYLHQHPLPESIVARLTSEQYRVSASYFIPAEAPIWQDEELASHFVVVNAPAGSFEPLSLSSPTRSAWSPEDMLLVPLMSAEKGPLGFIVPDAPLDGQRPGEATLGLCELFAQQAAGVIENARLSDELRTAAYQARESERGKNNALLTASHELRTPLTAIQGYLELLEDHGETLDEVSRARFVQNARRGCDELLLLLGNVLDAAQLDAEQFSCKTSPFALVQPVQLTLEMLEPIITREQRKIEVHIPDELFVRADELRLRQILLNLLNNALKYTPPGSPFALTATCAERAYVQHRTASRSLNAPFDTLARDPFVILAIQDRGPGIAPDEQMLLFTKLTRLASARNGMQRGAGLGLYLCRQLAEAMGGNIWMESSGVLGAGATFFVALPRCEG